MNYCLSEEAVRRSPMPVVESVVFEDFKDRPFTPEDIRTHCLAHGTDIAQEDIGRWLQRQIDCENVWKSWKRPNGTRTYVASWLRTH